jgi:PAS domain-containing protein/CheY-like chemotaxis protein
MRHAATPLLVLTLAALIFTADLELPRETVAGVAYVLPVALAFAAGASGPVLAASLCSLLILLAPGLSAAEGEAVWSRAVLANRFLALFAVWVVAVLAVRVRRLLDAEAESASAPRPIEQPAAPAAVPAIAPPVVVLPAADGNFSELSEEVKRFRRLAECGVIGLVVTGEAGELREANDAFLTMLGYTQDDLAAGRLHWSELTDPADDEADQLDGSLCELDCRHRDGGRVRMLTGRTPFDPESADDSRQLRFVIDLRNRRPLPTEEVRFASDFTDEHDSAWPHPVRSTARTQRPESPALHCDHEAFAQPARLPPARVELVGTPVLVVIARPPVRRLVEQELRRAHMLPSLVDSAFAALEEIRQANRRGRPFPLVVIDAELPEVSGLALAERLRREPEPDDAPEALLVLTSPAGPHGAAERCDRLGVTHCELDPARPGDVLDAVQAAMGVGRHGSSRHHGPSAAFPPSRRVDWPTALRSACGDRILLESLVREFLIDAPNWLRDARAAIAAGDAAALGRPARAIIRRARSLGCDDLATIAGQLEFLAARDRLDAAPALWDAVRSEYAAVAEDLSDFQMTTDASARPA